MGVGEGVSIARMVFTSPFLSSHVGISRMGMGAHWFSCPVCRNTSVKPGPQEHVPSCRGQHRAAATIDLCLVVLLECRHLSLLSSRNDDWSLPHLTTERLGGQARRDTGAVVHRRGRFRTASCRWKTKEPHSALLFFFYRQHNML